MEEIFTKSLKKSEVKGSCRCSFPTKCLKKLPSFKGKRSLVLPVGTRDGSTWRFRCDVRNKGRHLKPVLSGDWRRFSASQGLKLGDQIKLLKIMTNVVVQEEADDEFMRCYYRVEVKKASVVLFGTALSYQQPYLV